VADGWLEPEINYGILQHFRLHHMLCIRSGLLAADRLAWLVSCVSECACVCLCVCRSRSWALQKWLNWSRFRLGADSCAPMEPCIVWGPNPQGKGAIFWSCPAHWKAWRVCGVSCAKTGELIEVPFLGWLKSRNHVLDGGQGRTNPFAATRDDRLAILAHGWAVQKRMNWLRCCLGHWLACNEPCIRRGQHLTNPFTAARGDKLVNYQWWHAAEGITQFSVVARHVMWPFLRILWPFAVYVQRCFFKRANRVLCWLGAGAPW